MPSELPSFHPSVKPSSLPSEFPRWVQLGDDIDGEAAYDYSGSSVSISEDGRTVAVGAYGNDGNGSKAGHVRVYKLDGDNNWKQLGDDIDGEAAYDISGISVSISADGRTVAVGARDNDGTNGSSAGHVRVYRLDGDNNWEQLGDDIDGEAEGDESGTSVSISADGRTVAVGARLNDGNGSCAGHVRVYKLDGDNNWEQLGQDIDGEAEDDKSGSSVSISADGTTVAVGAYLNDGKGSDAGHVRVYRLDGDNNWEQLGQDIDGEAAYDYSGSSVSISADGRTVAVGAFLNDGNGSKAGHVRVYKLDEDVNDWVQLGEDIDGEAEDDQSGASLSISADGRTVAVGARLNDGNGSSAGHVRVYKLDGDNNWEQLGDDIDGEAEGDESGTSVSISADGDTVAVGAFLNDGNGSSAGHVRVFKL
eukprot:scaffold21470_cov42-Cyclotella_meneghiniana.AAC.1